MSTFNAATSTASANVDDARAALEKSKDDIARDLRSLVDEGQKLLAGSSSMTAERFQQAFSIFRNRLSDAQSKVVDIAGAATDRGREYARAADDYVHDNPWPAIAGAGIAGLLVGLMCSNRH